MCLRRTIRTMTFAAEVDEVSDQPLPHLAAPLRMELRSPDRAASHRAAERLPVLGDTGHG